MPNTSLHDVWQQGVVHSLRDELLSSDSVRQCVAIAVVRSQEIARQRARDYGQKVVLSRKGQTHEVDPDAHVFDDTNELVALANELYNRMSHAPATKR